MEAELDFSEAASWSAARVQQTVARLDEGLLRGAPDGVIQGATAGAATGNVRDLATALVRCALRLQNLAADGVTFGAIRETASPSVFLVAVQFTTEELGRDVMEGALKVLAAAATNEPLPLDGLLDQLREFFYEEFPARKVSYRNLAATLDIVLAARKRQIPTAQITPTYWGSLRLGQGSKHRRLRASEPDIVSGVARMASTDKPISNRLLQEAGVPTSRSRVVETVEEAWAAAAELGLPVVVKPADTDIGTGVTLDVRTRDGVEQAFREAIKHATKVLIEQFAPGIEHRVLVIGERVSAVTRVDPPQVIGDGVATIAELVKRENLDPRRGEEKDDTPWFRLKLDAEAIGVLAVEGLTIDSVPAAGQKVLVRRNPPYIKHGGVPTDVTDRLHPLTAAQAVSAAKHMQIHVAGLDVVALDISRPLEEQRGIFVEINTGPGLWLHLAPYIEPPRPVGRDIVDLLYAPHEDGRIPVAAVVGDSDDLATAHLTRLLAASGIRAGSASEQEIVIAGRRFVPQENSPQARAAVLFQNETVDAAILKTTPQELFEAGFGNDQCAVALVIGTPAAVEGTDESDCLQTLRNALSPTGILVLEAEQDEAAFSPPLPVERIIRYAIKESPQLAQHVRAGGTGVFTREGTIVLSQGAQPALVLGSVPTAIPDEELGALLAALAAARGLGQSSDALRAYVDSLSKPQPAARIPAALARPLIAGESSTVPETNPILAAARRRNIPATLLDGADPRFLRLGQGSKQRRCQGLEPETVSAVSRTASSDRFLSKVLLQEAGIPVSLSRVVKTADEAWAAACELGLPVAVKPTDGFTDAGVAVNLSTRHEIDAAIRAAVLIDKSVLVERFVPGSVFRIVVAGDRVIAVSLADAGESREPRADLSHVIHPELAAQAVAGAHALRLPVAVVEVMARDITKRLEEQEGFVLGVRLLDSDNPCGPAEQNALAEEVVAAFYPPYTTGRIPVVALLQDSSGATATHLAALLARAGLCAGIAGNSEITIAGRSWAPPGESPAERARAIFQSPLVDVALLKLSHAELQREGLGNDVCNVAVVLDPLLSAVARITEAESLVLPFEQSRMQAGVTLPVERIIWFGARADLAPPTDRLAERERAVFVDADSIVLAQGPATRVLLGKRPVDLKGEELAPLLAALAAAQALGLNIEVLQEYLSTY